MSARRPSDANASDGNGPRLSERCPVRAGEMIGDKYKVERLIGEGGMGIVVAAKHLRLGQRVAIKFLSADVANDAVVVGRFVHEAQAIAPLRSEHVVRVYDVSSQKVAAPYMVMEYLEGQDLGHLIEKRGPLPVADAVDYVLEACEGVAEAHAAGIIHRDLKPSNLFLARMPDGSAVVKVLDFGISKAKNQEGRPPRPAFTTTTDVLGTPAYMSPEQLRSSKDIDARADLWALGLILYELVTARAAFEADTMPQLCSKILAEEPPSPAEYRTDLAPELVAVILRCLRKNPEQRFADCGEMAMALAPFGGPSAGASAAKVARVLDAAPAHDSTVPPPGGPDDGDGEERTYDLVQRRGPTVASWGAGPMRASSPRHRGLAVLAVGALIGVLGGVVAVVVTRGEHAPALGASSPASTMTPSATVPEAVSLAPASAASVAPSASASASSSAARPPLLRAAPMPTVAAPKSSRPAADEDSQFGGRK